MTEASNSFAFLTL